MMARAVLLLAIGQFEREAICIGSSTRLSKT
jgi:hypothetical protein